MAMVWEVVFPDFVFENNEIKKIENKSFEVDQTTKELFADAFFNKNVQEEDKGSRKILC